jgi:hypothetical protein
VNRIGIGIQYPIIVFPTLFRCDANNNRTGPGLGTRSRLKFRSPSSIQLLPMTEYVFLHILGTEARKQEKELSKLAWGKNRIGLFRK